MPPTVPPVLPEGALRDRSQPTLAVDDELVLRPWRPDDAPAVRAAFDDPDIQRWHTRRIDDLNEAADWVRQWRDRWAGESDASWAIARAAGDRVVGQAGLRTIVLAMADAQLSYWVLPAERGRGVAGRAAAAVARWAFDELGLHRLALLHSTRNEASCRVAGRLAFPLEATFREYLLHTDGWHDTHVHVRRRA